MKFPTKTIETVIIILTALVLLAIVYLGWKTDQFSEANNFAGTLAPFFSFFGSVLVFYALKAQVKANKMIQEQFKQTHILTLIENLNSKIINSSLNIDQETFIGYSIFDKILQNLKFEQQYLLETSSIGIITSIPKEIEIYDYEKFLCCYSNSTISDVNLRQKAIDLKNELINPEIHPPKYLYDNFDINKLYESASNNEYKARLDFRESIYKRYFFNMDGEYRMNIYELSFTEFNKRFDIFLDSYFKSTFALLDAVYKLKKRRKENIEYLKNVFTNQEKILLYHRFMSGKTTKQFGIYLIELEIFNMTLDSKYFPFPYGIERYKKDLEYIKPLTYKTD